jgi:hypothetical protein
MIDGWASCNIGSVDDFSPRPSRGEKLFSLLLVVELFMRLSWKNALLLVTLSGVVAVVGCGRPTTSSTPPPGTWKGFEGPAPKGKDMQRDKMAPPPPPPPPPLPDK